MKTITGKYRWPILGPNTGCGPVIIWRALTSGYMWPAGGGIPHSAPDWQETMIRIFIVLT